MKERSVHRMSIDIKRGIEQRMRKSSQALEHVHQIRVSLGLPATPKSENELAEVPANLDQTFSAVREVQGKLMEVAATLGVSGSFNKLPHDMEKDFFSRYPNQDIDQIFAKLLQDAPDIKRAQTKLLQAERNLDQAKLNLRYCKVYAEIDGAITSKNVNPGNNVTAGQSLMTIRSLHDLWIDANFKETQLAKLRIGQPVKIETDMYGSHQEFEGRISGFTMGTGQTLSLLPPQNATGNYVKIVQRLPVKIELTDYDPDKAPLFAGLSVTPYVYFKERGDRPECRQSSAAATRIEQSTVNTQQSRELSRRCSTSQGKTMSSASSIALNPGAAISRPAVNVWIIAIIVVVPTFMEILDTTIANVALRYIAGGLSAAQTDADWVITSYLAANAIVLPITGWLSSRLGRRNYFLLCIALFTLRLGHVRIRH